jgi:hypothetical protein
MEAAIGGAYFLKPTPENSSYAASQRFSTFTKADAWNPTFRKTFSDTESGTEVLKIRWRKRVKSIAMKW